MPYRPRKFTCPDCGAEVIKKRPKYKVVRCTPHAIAFQAEYNRQMAAKSGPLFEHWAGMIALQYLPGLADSDQARASLGT